LRNRLVDAIDFAGKLDGVVLLLLRSRVEDLVDVLGAGQAGDADLGNVLAKGSASAGKATVRCRSHLDLPIAVQQELKLEALLALVAHRDDRL
jgi:hypothetical protein